MPNRRGGTSSGKQPLRLPIIAPKDDASSSRSANRSTDVNSPNLSVPSRVRLPPRSRTGCWTCRRRKVKCDEGRPTCGQCARLGHVCDYNPRLSFRDDTPRVMGRMAEVFTTGNSVWDPTSPTRASSRSNTSPVDDTLPPFAYLTSDEERERKAEAYTPGTYHVIVNPNSFSALPEYAETSADGGSAGEPDVRRGSVASSKVGSIRGDEHENAMETDDPNVVILSKFEDTPRRPSSVWRTSRLSATPEAADPSPTSVFPQLSLHDPVTEGLSGPLEQVVARGSDDAKLLAHFRDVVWKQLVQTQSFQGGSPISHFHVPGAEIFEQEAATFRPLFHAMMAVSALSLAHQDGGQSIDALQHYQQAFPSLQTSLRSPQDLCSDGLFLTHFLLLIYEIAAAEPGGSNLWSHHISRLLRISLMRRSTLGSERYPFIIWWVCTIDLYALFSGAGSGEFVGAMVKGNMLPGPDTLLYPTSPTGYSVIYPEENDSLPMILQMHYDTFVLAIRLGFLAADLRREAMSSRFLAGSVGPAPFANPTSRLKKLLELRNSLRLLWESPNAIWLRQNMSSFPPRSVELWQQSISLYHACVLFSYTSMWPGQRLGPEGSPDEELMRHSAAILRIAESIIRAGRFDLRFIIFPLFTVGVSTPSGSQKMMALDFISSMERAGVGRNATTTRHILQIVYERQTQQLIAMGHSFHLYWVDIMIEQGLQVVNFGL
ncbi:transcriptional regulator family: Fungal Specific TF [Paecilomyces variotii]|nr:transcriptional regulator family: Fungal Specific TF [Paecilomyces variotii]